MVHLRGVMAEGSTDSVAFVLPSGLRPAHQISIPAYTNFDTPGFLVIGANGDVIPVGSAVAGGTSLDGISFVAGE